MAEIIGILLIAQGLGGTINNIAGDGPSWFLLNHIDALEGARLPLHVVMALLGLGIVVLPHLRKWGRLRGR
ncbi:hypothetical protein ACFS2C_03805 [Prauserella oleivorans]|uniref:Uncharacterized protein n=1 Tax=Prauserella oleivorans TaxID=1478153 RepID=A0ABW5W3P3_9PSEU